MIILKKLLKEIEDEGESDIDFDRLMWNDSYLEDVAEKLGYNHIRINQ
jgi:hypothetical protein